MNPRNGTIVGTSPQAVENALTGPPLSLNYRPALPGQIFWNGDSMVSYWRVQMDVEAMLAHGAVQAPLSYYKAGISGMEVAFKASSPEVEQYVTTEWQRFLQRCREKAQRSYDYGRCGYEPTYEREGGYLRLEGLEDFFPLDATVLTRGGAYAGVRVRHVEGADNGTVDLWGPADGPVPGCPPKGFWLSHNRRHNRWYGWTQLYAAWKPWRRLAGRDGMEDIIDLGAYKHAVGTDVVRYPPGDLKRRADGKVEGAREKATEMVEGMKSGSGWCLPSTNYSAEEGGHPKWAVESIDHEVNIQQLGEEAERCKREISLGIGVPPELQEASEVGSGWSGRAIPLEGFYLGQQSNAENFFSEWKKQIGDPLVSWNFGPEAWFTGTVASLLESKMRAAAKASQPPQQPGQAGQPGQPPPSGGGNGQQWQPQRGPRGGNWEVNGAGDKRPLRLSTHAPHNITIGGKEFKGGEFIPEEALKAATPQERRQLAAGKKAAVGHYHRSRKAAVGAIRQARELAGNLLDLTDELPALHWYDKGYQAVYKAANRIAVETTKGAKHGSLRTDLLYLSKSAAFLAKSMAQEPPPTPEDEEEHRQTVNGLRKIAATALRAQRLFDAARQHHAARHGTPDSAPVQLATAADGTLYHGPKPPGSGWVPVSVGPRGGKVWGRRANTPREVNRQEITAHLKHHASRAAIASAKATGHVAVSLHAATKQVAGRIGQAAWEKLPPKAQWGLAKTWKLARAVEHKVMIGFSKAKELAKEAAKERGASPQTVELTGKILAAVDLGLAWTVNMPATYAVTGSFGAAKVASWVPVASLAYIAYSTSRNPFATVRAAKNLIKGTTGAHAPALAMATQPHPDAALHGRLVDGIEAHGDWYAALVSAAFDKTHSLAQALDMADAALKQQPTDPAGEGAGDRPFEMGTFDPEKHPHGQGGRWAAVTGALKAKHPFPDPIPLSPPGTARDDLIAKDPVLAEASRREKEHTLAYRRAYSADLIHRTLNERPERPVPLPPPEADVGKRIKRAKRAIEAVTNADTTVVSLGDAFRTHHEAVASSHPEGAEALAAARTEAQRRLNEARKNAEAHIVGLPAELRKKAARLLPPATDRPFEMATGDDYYHGPQPPDANWHLVGIGSKGGKIWAPGPRNKAGAVSPVTFGKIARRLEREARTPDEKVAVTEGPVKVNRVYQDWAEHNEWLLAREIAGESIRDNKEVDVVFQARGPTEPITHGIEVKTLLRSKRGAVRIGHEARARKEEWAAQGSRVLHLVVLDNRDIFGKGNRVPTGNRPVFPCYYSRRIGNLSVTAMHKVESAEELKRLMTMPADQLPENARPATPPPH